MSRKLFPQHYITTTTRTIDTGQLWSICVLDYKTASLALSTLETVVCVKIIRSSVAKIFKPACVARTNHFSLPFRLQHYLKPTLMHCTAAWLNGESYKYSGVQMKIPKCGSFRIAARMYKHIQISVFMCNQNISAEIQRQHCMWCFYFYSSFIHFFFSVMAEWSLPSTGFRSVETSEAFTF